MNTVASNDPRIQEARVTEDEIIARLADGRIISVPLAWSWRLSEATPKQRANFRLIGSGQGVHWPDVDEDISVEGMLHGIPARRPRPVSFRPRVVQTSYLCRSSRPARMMWNVVVTVYTFSFQEGGMITHTVIMEREGITDLASWRR